MKGTEDTASALRPWAQHAPLWVAATTVALCSLAGCVIEPRKPRTVVPQSLPIYVVAARGDGPADPVPAQALCSALARSGWRSPIRCFTAGTQPGAARNAVRLAVHTELSRPSRDIRTNLLFSLRTATTGVRVTNSARLTLTVGIHRNTKAPPELFQATARARTGVHFYLPLYTGLIGTLLGSSINDSQAPPLVRNRCLRIVSRTEEWHRHRDCIDYRRILEDGLGRLTPLIARRILSGHAAPQGASL